MLFLFVSITLGVFTSSQGKTMLISDKDDAASKNGIFKLDFALERSGLSVYVKENGTWVFEAR